MLWVDDDGWVDGWMMMELQFISLLRQYMNNKLQKTTTLYLRFLPKEPQLVLGFAHRVFGVRSGPRGPVSLSFGRVADGPV